MTITRRVCPFGVLLETIPWATVFDRNRESVNADRGGKTGVVILICSGFYAYSGLAQVACAHVHVYIHE